MLKILVLGATGMAGHVITTYFKEKKVYEVSNLSYRRKLDENTVILDVTNLTKLNEYLNEKNFDVIINCIGILNQYAEDNKDIAILVNSYLPHFLEKKYNNSSTKIIHLSTDCVFLGKSGGYKENSFKDGDTFYDRTKALGEIYEGNNLTFRMSIIGPDCNYDGIGLFNWFMKSTGEVNGYVNAIWTGVTTIELAKCIEKAIQQDLRGLYHLVPKTSINKYDLLVLFKEKFNKKDIIINKFENKLINKSLINTRKDFDYIAPSYEKMIIDMKNWMKEHEFFYGHYR